MSAPTNLAPSRTLIAMANGVNTLVAGLAAVKVDAADARVAAVVAVPAAVAADRDARRMTITE